MFGRKQGKILKLKPIIEHWKNTQGLVLRRADVLYKKVGLKEVEPLTTRFRAPSKTSSHFVLSASPSV